MRDPDPIAALDRAIQDARAALRSLGLDPDSAPLDPHGGPPRIAQDPPADPDARRVPDPVHVQGAPREAG